MNPTTIIIISVVIICFMFIVTLVFLICCVFQFRRRNKHRYRDSDPEMVRRKSNLRRVRHDFDFTNYDEDTYASFQSKLLSKFNQIKLEPKLRRKSSTKPCMSIDSTLMLYSNPVATGQYGIIYKGQFSDPSDPDGETRTVTVKTVSDSASIEVVTEFIEDARSLISFNHNHVLSALGIATNDNTPFVFFPWMEYGDLRTYVREQHKHLSQRMLLEFCEHVLFGMTFLASQKFIHGDIAARNCVVGADGAVRVSDVGLSRDFFSEEYCNSPVTHKLIPVRWMAVECLNEDGCFSEKSDVWSFGVLTWELMTFGETPFAELDHETVKNYVINNGRLTKPADTPSEIYDLMKVCWYTHPQDRPVFHELGNRLRLVMNGISRFPALKNRAEKYRYW